MGLVPLGILAFGFLAPALFAAGAAAVSIPIVIHLLNKRRFRVVVWAAMEFLLAAQRRNARRLKMHRWLLLAVRCLALLLIAAGMARLVVNSTVFAGALGGQRVVVVVWDDSYSMGYAKPGEMSGFEKSKKLLTDWLSGGDLGASDKVMVIHASRGGVRGGAAPSLDHASLLASVRAARVTDAGTDLEAMFEQAGETLKGLESATRTRQVVVLTDFSRSSVRTGSEGNAEGLKKAMAAVGGHATSVRVIDVGAVDQGNLAVTKIAPKRTVVVAGAATEFDVSVMNATDRVQIDLPLTVAVDGVVQHTEKLGRIEAGATRTVEVPLTMASARKHLIEARLPADFLAVDDVRRFVVNVRREIPVLLVEGSPGSATYLWAAYGLAVDGKLGSVFAPKRITELELPTTVLSEYAEIVLADTAAPTASMTENLKRYVEAGGLLMVFPGNRTNASLMNGALGAAGLLPATFGQPVRMENLAEMAKGVPFAAEGFTHPILEKFRDASKSGADFGFLSVQTNEYLKLGVPPDGSVETLLRYAEVNGAPGDAAIVAKRVGKGRVVMFASSADNAWNTWGGKPSYVPVVHELTYYVLPAERERLTYDVGEKAELPAEVASPGAWVGPRATSLMVASATTAEGRSRLRTEALPAAGVYVAPGGDGRAVLAANPEGAEADIRHVSAGEMAAALGVEEKDLEVAPRTLDWPTGTAVGEAGGSLLGPGLIAGALVLFVVEALLAMVFSTYR